MKLELKVDNNSILSMTWASYLPTFTGRKKEEESHRHILFCLNYKDQKKNMSYLSFVVFSKMFPRIGRVLLALRAKFYEDMMS